jgi:phage anti-repressor protein
MRRGALASGHGDLSLKKCRLLRVTTAAMDIIAHPSTEENASLIAYVRGHVDDSIDPDIVDFFLLTVVDFADVEYPINGEDAMKWLDYGRADHFKRFYTRVLVENVDYGITPRSGGNSTAGRPSMEVHFTVDGFKDLCMAAGTDQGRRIRSYYRTLEKIHAQYFVHSHATARQLLITSAEDARLQREDAVHEAIMSSRKAGVSVTYLALVKRIDDEWFILKVGETDNVFQRKQSLSSQFGRIRFLHALDCLDAHGLEQEIKKHPTFVQNKTRDYFGSTETALVNDDIYSKIKAIMDKLHPTFNIRSPVEELEMRRLIVQEDSNNLERERLEKVDIQDSNTRALIARRDAQICDTLTSELRASSKRVDDIAAMIREHPRELHLFEMFKIANAELSKNRELLGAIATAETRSAPDTTASDESQKASTSVSCPLPDVKRRFKNYIQQYDADTFKLLNYFEGPNHAVVHMGEGAAQNLTDAARAKTVYCGYRWAEVEKTADPKVSIDIGATVKIQKCRTGLVARLSDDLLSVSEVFESQMAAAAKKGCTNSAICQMIRKTKPGHESSRWLWWRDVSPGMQQEYLKRATLPAKPQRNGRAVVRIDIATRQDIDRYDTAAEVIVKFAVGADSLKSACDGRTPLKGYLWKWADE